MQAGTAAGRPHPGADGDVRGQHILEVAGSIVPQVWGGWQGREGACCRCDCDGHLAAQRSATISNNPNKHQAVGCLAAGGCAPEETDTQSARRPPSAQCCLMSAAIWRPLPTLHGTRLVALTSRIETQDGTEMQRTSACIGWRSRSAWAHRGEHRVALSPARSLHPSQVRSARSPGTCRDRGSSGQASQRAACQSAAMSWNATLGTQCSVARAQPGRTSSCRSAFCCLSS